MHFWVDLSKWAKSNKNLRGLGYDNGSDIRGTANGAQNRILNINSKEFFMPCNLLSLNLVVNDVATSYLKATSFFSLKQKIYNYF